jgi:hypothetical protein
MPKKNQKKVMNAEEFNKNAAIKAFKYLKEHILGATNAREGTIKNILPQKEIEERLGKIRELEVKNPELTLGWFREIAATALKEQVGNCCETSAVCFNFFLEFFKDADPPVAVEIFNNPFLDHFFIVIGRTTGNPNDPRTWNKEAVIVDFWADEITPVWNIDFSKKASLPTAFINLINSSAGFHLQRDRLRVTESERDEEYAHFKKESKGNTELYQKLKIKEPRIISSDIIVQRQSVLVGKNASLPNKRMRLNAKIPMMYKDFYIPNKKDYKKHEKETSERIKLQQKENALVKSAEALISHSLFPEENKEFIISDKIAKKISKKEPR